MKEWDYTDETPFIPIKIIGSRRKDSKLAIVDTGAKYCVIHEAIAEDLELDKISEEQMIGFGSKTKFEVDLCIASVDIGVRMEIIQVASVKDKNYPEKAPKVIIGRNLLNKFKIILDGNNKKIFLE